MERPLDPRSTLRRFTGPALVASALLLAGYLRTAEGTAHPSPWGYRTWSFGALAYSDILALHEDRGAARHPPPYLGDRIEYPVLMGLGMWWPSVLAPGRAGYFALTYLSLALCALATLWFVASFPGSNPWAFGASPALLVYPGLNWDLFGLLPLALGVWLWARGQTRWGAAVLAIAVWTKLFPVLVLGVLLLVELRRSRARALELLGIFTAVSLAVNLPFALLAPGNWAWFFQYSSIRDIEPSLYLLFGAHPRTFVPAANGISVAVTLLAAAALAAVELRTRRLDPLPAACALVCVFFLGSKIFSPQYWLWVVALAALVGVPGWLAAALGAVALGDFVASFSRLHLQSDRAWAQVAWFDRQVFWPSVALRYAAVAICAAWAFSRCLRRPAVPAQPGCGAVA